MKINWNNLEKAKISGGVYNLEKLGCEIDAHTPQEVAARIDACRGAKDRKSVIKVLLGQSLANKKWCCETTRRLEKDLKKNNYKPDEIHAFVSEIGLMLSSGFVELPARSGNSWRNLFRPDLICITPALVQAIMRKGNVHNHS